jgi:hypothetical protein
MGNKKINSSRGKFKTEEDHSEDAKVKRKIRMSTIHKESLKKISKLLYSLQDL